MNLIGAVHEIFTSDSEANCYELDPPTKENMQTAYELLMRLYRKWPYRYFPGPCLSKGVAIQYSSIMAPRDSILFSVCGDRTWVGVNIQGEEYVKKIYTKPTHVPDGFVGMYMHRIRLKEEEDIKNGNFSPFDLWY